MPSPPAQPERSHSLSELNLDNLSFADFNSNQTPTTPRYAVFSWADAVASQYHGWDPRIYSDPLPSTSTAPHPFDDNQFLDAAFAPVPPIESDGNPKLPAQVPPHDDEGEELQPGTHSSTSILLHHPFPHHQNSGPWFASRGGTPVGNHSYGFEFYSSAPSSPCVADTDMTETSAGKPTTQRVRPAIALDPTQPLRVDGKPRERVYVACERCRVRKLRCDGAQPTCHNCQRAAKGAKCVYPSGAPKRRGADKAQRIRSPIGQRQPRKTTTSKRGGRAGSESATEGSSSVPGTPDD